MIQLPLFFCSLLTRTVVTDSQSLGFRSETLNPQIQSTTRDNLLRREQASQGGGSRSETRSLLGIKEGIAAIVQPGGSDRDFESIEACNQASPKVTMVFTGQRAFRH